MNFKKEYLLLCRNSFIRKQTAALLAVTAIYWVFVFSGYYQQQILPAAQSWMAFLANLGFTLLFTCYSTSTIGHCLIMSEKSALPFFQRHPQLISRMLSYKFWLLVLINLLTASLNYWLFVLLVGPYLVYDLPFFHTVYFTLLCSLLLIQAVTFASSLSSITGNGNHLPDKHAFKGFVLALLISFLSLKLFQYQIQLYIDYLTQETEVYPLRSMFYTIGAAFSFSILLTVIYLESSSRTLIKRIGTDLQQHTNI